MYLVSGPPPRLEGNSMHPCLARFVYRLTPQMRVLSDQRIREHAQRRNLGVSRRLLTKLCAGICAVPCGVPPPPAVGLLVTTQLLA